MGIEPGNLPLNTPMILSLGGRLWFTHSRYFYSAYSSLLLIRSAADTSRIMRRFHADSQQETASEGLAQGPYLASRACSRS